jgi:pimeloyl-ACP methyl ester carboxylesterase
MMELVEVDGGVWLGVADEGDGPVVVLLHGWPVTGYHWRHTSAALVRAGLRVLTIELRGLGGSSRGPGPFDKETLSAEVAGVLVRLDVERFAVVGHDWGGTVGYLLAADHADRVDALVVEEEMLPGIDTAIPEPGRSQYPTWHGPFNRAPGLAEALIPGREDGYYGAFLRHSAGPAGLSVDAELTYLAAYRQPASLAASVGYYRTAHTDREAVARRARTPLAVPVLTVGGQFGMGHGVADCFAQVARHVDHVQIDGAGHYPAEQHPDEVNARLVTFLAAKPHPHQ